MGESGMFFHDQQKKHEKQKLKDERLELWNPRGNDLSYSQCLSHLNLKCLSRKIGKLLEVCVNIRFNWFP